MFNRLSLTILLILICLPILQADSWSHLQTFITDNEVNELDYHPNGLYLSVAHKGQ